MLSVFHRNVFAIFYSTSKGERNQTVKVSYCKEGEVKITLYKYCYSGVKQSLMILLPEFLKFFFVKFSNLTRLWILLFFNLLHAQLGEVVWIFSLFFLDLKITSSGGSKLLAQHVNRMKRHMNHWEIKLSIRKE